MPLMLIQNLLKIHGIQICMTTAGKAKENGYAERFMRTIKEEEVYLSEYLNFGDAVQQIRCFIEDVNNTKRIHSSLGYLTPAEFDLHAAEHVGVKAWLGAG